MTMRLLAFDDDAAVGRLVTRIATLTGMQASAVTNAEAFRQALRDAPPQVVALDLQLGSTDGIAQLRELAAAGYAGALVLMSGFDARVLETTAALARSLGLHVAGILPKPIRASELEGILQHLLLTAQEPTLDGLLAAIRQDELTLELQPIVERHPRTLHKLEGLVRWNHPTLGRLTPEAFVPMAETDPTAIDALTEWVFGAAVLAWQRLAEHGLRVPIAVNVSSRNLHDLTLPDRLERRLHRAGMPMDQFGLELTETAAFHDTARIMEVIGRLRLKGVQLAIDDFGTGYSSLKLLRQMPFCAIKIDRSFVADATTSRDSRAIVKSILDLAANMEMDSIAEGVETEETAALLEQLGASRLQGHLIAPSLPVDAVPAWLAVWTNQPGRPAQRARSSVPMLAAPGGLSPVDRRPVAGTVSLGDSLTANATARLSPRQLDVIRLLSEGHPVKEIARRLELSVGTVKVHLSLAYSALGVRNRVEAVLRVGMLQTGHDAASVEALPQ